MLPVTAVSQVEDEEISINLYELSLQRIVIIIVIIFLGWVTVVGTGKGQSKYWESTSLLIDLLLHKHTEDIEGL